MKKEKQIKTHQRRTKSGKSVIVRAHTAKYDAAEELRRSLAKKKGAGDELESRKRQTPIETPDLGFTDAEFKEWYHWDQEGDPKNKTALKVEKALIAKMGKRAYNKYFNDLSDSYSARGHAKAYKSLVAEHTEAPTPKTPKTPKTSKKEGTPDNPVETTVMYKGKKVRALSFGPVEEAHTDYGVVPKHLGVSQSEWNDWMEGGDSYAKVDKAVTKHLESLYGKKGAKVLRDTYEGDGSNTFIEIAESATPTSRALSVLKKTPTTLKDVMGVKLPRANKFGEHFVSMTAKQRNDLIERAMQSGWRVESVIDSSANTWRLLTNGEHTISINSGKDKLFNEVAVMRAVKRQDTFNPQPTEKTSWGHTSKVKGKSVRSLDAKGQANYNGIIASGIKLPKKFTYDSDTRSDWYDSFRTKDGQAISSVLQQAKKAKWQSSGDGRSKMKKFTSPDGRVHILINRDDKSASIFYR